MDIASCVDHSLSMNSLGSHKDVRDIRPELNADLMIANMEMCRAAFHKSISQSFEGDRGI